MCIMFSLSVFLVLVCACLSESIRTMFDSYHFHSFHWILEPKTDFCNWKIFENKRKFIICPEDFVFLKIVWTTKKRIIIALYQIALHCFFIYCIFYYSIFFMFRLKSNRLNVFPFCKCYIKNLYCSAIMKFHYVFNWNKTKTKKVNCQTALNSIWY